MEHLLQVWSAEYGMWFVIIMLVWFFGGIYLLLKSLIKRWTKAYASNMTCLLSAAAFWQAAFPEWITSEERTEFGNALHAALVASYLKHASYPDIGIGELSGTKACLGFEDLLFPAAVAARIVPQSFFGQDQLSSLLPHGRMQIRDESVIFIGDDGKIKQVWSSI